MFNSTKNVSFVAFGLLSSVFGLASVAFAQGGSFQGQYSGVGEAAGAVLTLSQNGQQVVGRLQTDGTTYVVQAQVSGSEGYGMVGDPTTGAAQPFRLSMNGGGVLVTLPQSAGARSDIFRFVRGARRAQDDLYGASPGGGSPGGGYPGGRYPGGGEVPGASPMDGGAPGGQLDPRLVGRWRKTESMVSGGASFVSDQHLVVRADGTFSTWSGGAAGGNAYVSGVVGGGGSESGRWRVQGNVVEVSDGGSFQPFARYVVDGSDLMFVFGDGSKELWSRR